MAYTISYLSEVERTLQAVMIDDRANQFPPNADGNVIAPIVAAKLAEIGTSSIPYKIETSLGNLGGIFVLLIDRQAVTATLQFSIIRPQFDNELTAINTAITDFINSGDWFFDILLS